MEFDKLIAYCGEPCSTCQIYLATRETDKEKQAEARMRSLDLPANITIPFSSQRISPTVMAVGHHQEDCSLDVVNTKQGRVRRRKAA